jgi:uncharacterized protein
MNILLNQRKQSAALAIALCMALSAGSQTRVIDMHLHCYDTGAFREQTLNYYGELGSPDAIGHFRSTYASMKRNHIIKAVVSGTPSSVRDWVTKDTGHLFIRGILVNDPAADGLDTISFLNMVRSGQVQVFGELQPYYAGGTLSDSVWKPYLKICEQYDIPVAVHTGGGDPGGTYTSTPKARLKFGDPYLIEDVLVAFPKLRVYIMHSGEDWYEHALRLMAYYPKLYSDLGVLLWVEPMDQRYAIEFLKRAKEAGYLDRVMFGTDQMKWPSAIDRSIRFLNSLTFLSSRDKEGILYSNAARFLKIVQ